MMKKKEIKKKFNYFTNIELHINSHLSFQQVVCFPMFYENMCKFFSALHLSQESTVVQTKSI